MSSLPDELRLLTVSEVSDWLSVSPSLIYQLVERGELAVYRIGTGRGSIRFRREDVDAYLADCRSQNSSQIEPRKQRPRLKHIQVR